MAFFNSSMQACLSEFSHVYINLHTAYCIAYIVHTVGKIFIIYLYYLYKFAHLKINKGSVIFIVGLFSHIETEY